jgi:hypothetical protein
VADRHVGMRAEQALPQRDAEAELIAGRGRAPAGVLFGGHVRRRADHRAGLGDVGRQRAGPGRVDRARGRHHRRLGADLVGGPGHAEVGHRDPARAIDEHVARLDVAMDQAGGVGGRQPAPGLDVEAHDLIPARPLAGQVLAERRPLDELHRQEHPARGLADLVDRDDVRVRQLGQGLGLADQPGRGVGAAGPGLENLDRHPAVEVWIVGRVDLAHAASADLPLDHEAADHRPRPQPVTGGRRFGTCRHRDPGQGLGRTGHRGRFQGHRSLVVAVAHPASVLTTGPARPAAGARALRNQAGPIRSAGRSDPTPETPNGSRSRLPSQLLAAVGGWFVRKGGLEPPRCYPLEPESSASTNSATFAVRAVSNQVRTILRCVRRSTFDAGFFVRPRRL